MWNKVICADQRSDFSEVDQLLQGQREIKEMLVSFGTMLKLLRVDQDSNEDVFAPSCASVKGANSFHCPDHDLDAEPLDLTPALSVADLSKVPTGEESDDVESRSDTESTDEVGRHERFILPDSREPSMVKSVSFASRVVGELTSSEMSWSFPPVLDNNWPLNLRIREQLVQLEQLNDLTPTSTGCAHAKDEKPAYSPEGEAMRSFSQCLIIDPEGWFSLCVDLLSAVVLIVDLVWIPVAVAWDVKMEGWAMWFAWFTALFWSFDLLRAFITAKKSVSDGEYMLLTDFRLIALRYLKERFLIDFLIVLFDWANILITLLQGAIVIKLLRIAKIVRLLRVARIVRLSRTTRHLDEVMDCYISGGWRVLLKVFIILMFVFLFGHSASCAWYAIARQVPSDTGASWLDAAFDVEERVRSYHDLNPRYLYATAFHWSMAQLTMGANELIPRSTTERVANILMLFLGLLFSSTLVSALSATLIDYQIRASERNHSLRSLRRYLDQNKVPVSVQLRVRKQIEQRLSNTPMLMEKDVPVLDKLSTSVRAALRFAIMQDHLMRLPLFRVWTHFSDSTVKDMCSDDSIVCRFLQESDEIFSAGALCHEAFHLMHGTVRYTQEPDSAMIDKTAWQDVNGKTWMCEAALWTTWFHVGRAEAMTKCKLMSLPAERVLDMLRKHRLLRQITVSYGHEYHRRILAARPPESDWPTDLVVPFTEFGDIVEAMDDELQFTICLQAGCLRLVETWGVRKYKMLKNLELETRCSKHHQKLLNEGYPEGASLIVFHQVAT